MPEGVFEGAWSYGSEFKNIWPLFRYFPLGEIYRRLIYICGCHSVTKSCPTLCDPMNHSTPGFPVLYCLLEFAQTLVRGISDAIQPSHPLSLPSPPAFSLSQHQGLFQWVGSSHQVVKVLELQLQHQSFQWIFRVDSFSIDWFDLLALQGTLKSFLQHCSSKASILWHWTFFMAQLSHPYLTTEKIITLTLWTFVGQVMSLLFNTLSKFVIPFLKMWMGLVVEVKSNSEKTNIA